MLCNPIFIHSFVVFVRLYWFERRFRNIVREARYKSRSRIKTEPRVERDQGAAENGVGGRSIVVIHNDQRPQKLDTLKQSRITSESSQGNKPQEYSVPFHREVTFADEVPVENSSSRPQMKPQLLSLEQHIAIREKQRNLKDEGALRIPGPRDFDRGSVPEPLYSNDGGGELMRQITSIDEQGAALNGNPAKRNITIDEPEHPGRPKTDPLTFPKLHKPKSDLHDIANAPTEEGPHPSRLRTRTGTFSSVRNWASKENEPVAPYLSWQPTIGRNSAFVDLTEEQREELGGIEYRSLKTLAIVLIAYFMVFHLLGVIVLLPWIIRTAPWNDAVQSFGVSKAWWGIFTPASLFNDLGYTLTPDSFQSFQMAVLPLLLGSFLIIIGNTGFPCMLRFVIWIASKVTSRGSGVWEELRFLLDHPRRCFTLLFPATATWWLFWILVVLNGVDIIFFIILDVNDEAVSNINPVGFRVLNGLFQATSTRTAGFASVNLAQLHPGIQVSYMIMMYISVFPIAISMRRTNVYEEKSLGIYSSVGEDNENDKEPSYVGAHLRRQLSFDLWYIFLGLFIIAIVEGKHIENTNEYAFTLFSVLFEIVSAYGTVGLSLGYPDFNTSFSGQFAVISKLIIIAMQIRGRHRGLPYELDRAILLPSDQLHRNEDVDAGRRVQRRNSAMSNMDPGEHALASRPSTGPRVSTAAQPQMGSSSIAEASGRDQVHSSTHDIEKLSSSSRSNHLRRGLGKMMAGITDGPGNKPKEV
ncbi:MAG: hypothetical protein Q9163_005961 [Psora crenata]